MKTDVQPEKSTWLLEKKRPERWFYVKPLRRPATREPKTHSAETGIY